MASLLLLAAAAVAQTPHDFGYVVGDMVTRHVSFTPPPGSVLDMRSLPQAGPVSASLDLREVRVHGNSLDLVYQNFLSPEQVVRAEAPGFTLGFVNGARRLTEEVPGFGFAVSPIRHDLQPVIDPHAMRPDHAVVAPDTAWLKNALLVSACLGSASLVGVIFLRAYPGPGRHAGPFAAAAARIAEPALNARARCVALHRAFDSTDGAPVLRADVDRFVMRHPEFASLHAEIRAFFEASNEAFFGDGADPPGDIAGLAHRLAKAERRA